MTSDVKAIWLVSWAFVILALLVACLYDGGDFVLLYILPGGVFASAFLLGIIAFVLWLCGAGRRLTMVIAFALTVTAMLFFLWNFTDGDFILSNSAEDFQRFAMDGPHWPEDDAEYKYHPGNHPLPSSVRIIESRTFNGFDGEGAALLFKVSKRDLVNLISSESLLPSNDAKDWHRLNRWTGWYLWKTSRALGTAPSLYIRKGPDGNTIETASLAISQDGTRALFLYLNVN